MPVKIEISRIETVSVPKQAWVKLADTGGRDGGADYGHSPAIEEHRQERVTVYEQLVPDNEFDLQDVIRAVNRL